MAGIMPAVLDRRVALPPATRPFLPISITSSGNDYPPFPRLYIVEAAVARL